MSEAFEDVAADNAPKQKNWRTAYRHELLAEIDRLRAELEKLRASPNDNAVQLHKVAAMATTLNEENDRLRAENAELWKAAKDVYDCWGHPTPLWDTLHAILAKTDKPDYAPARDPSDHLACGNVG